MLFFDKFMVMHTNIQDVLLPLVSVTCLGLAEKMLERKRKFVMEQCTDEEGDLWQYQILTYFLEFDYNIEMCKTTFGHEYQSEMFQEAELKIFEQFDFQLN